MNSDWTEEKLALLREMWPTNSADVVASALNVQFNASYTRNAVIGKAHRIGMPTKSSRRPVQTEVTPKPRAPRRTTPFYPRPPMPIVELAPAPEGGVTLMGLEDGMCRWPQGPGTYCGGGTGGARVTYCPIHRKAGTQETRPVQRGGYVKLGGKR